MKCYPCIRGCGIFKVILGLILVGTAIWFIAEPTELMDCPGLMVQCPTAFGDLIKELEPSVDPANAESEIQAYCDCLNKCINYMTVYEGQQDTNEETNCFLQSTRAGIRSSYKDNRRLFDSKLPPFSSNSFGQSLLARGRRLEDDGSLPGTSKQVCVSCEEVDEHEYVIFNTLGGIAGSTGLALLIVAACEFMDIKFQSKLFALCVLFTDLVCGLALFIATCVAFGCLHIAVASCDPESMKRVTEDAGADSTDGEADHSAAYARFLFALLEPMAENLCTTAPKFTLFACVAMVGLVSTLWSFVATTCVCLGMTEDGYDGSADDVRAAEMSQLMTQS